MKFLTGLELLMEKAQVGFFDYKVNNAVVLNLIIIFNFCIIFF